MLKVLELLSRRADRTHDEAMTYWTERHAALVKASAQDDLKTRRYVNNVGLRTGYEQWPPFATSPYDGIVSVWVDRSFESLRRIILSPLNSFVPDEPNFVRCRPYLMPVDELVARPVSGAVRCKLMVLFARPLDAAGTGWVRHWQDQHVPREIAFWGDRLAGLTSNVARPFGWSDWGDEIAAYDGCAEYWFTIDAAEVIAALAAWPAELVASQQQCIGASARMFVREVVQIDRDAGA
jgi:hypothetical protein